MSQPVSPDTPAEEAQPAGSIEAVNQQASEGGVAVGVNHGQINVPNIVHRRSIQWPTDSGVAPAKADGFQDRLVSRSVPKSGTTVLSGPSGFGKTQIAADIYDKSGAELRVWIEAASPSEIIAGYARAAVRIGLVEEAIDATLAAKEFLDWTSRSSRTWLIVLDNLEQPERMFAKQVQELQGDLWPPVRSNGLTIATSSLRDNHALLGASRKIITVHEYSTDEAESYLKKCLELAIAESRLPADALDESSALASDLGNHPLALGLAVAVILANGLSVRAYRKLLSESLTKAFPTSVSADGYQRSMLASFKLALDKANESTKGLAGIMLLKLSYLSPLGSPESLLVTRGFVGLRPDDDQVRATMRVLHQLCLLSHRPGSVFRELSVHPLNGRIARDTIQWPLGRRILTWSVADALFQVWPVVENNRSLLSAIFASVSSLLDNDTSNLLYKRPWISKLRGGRGSIHPILLRYGRSLTDAGFSETAVTYLLRVVDQCRNILGEHHHETCRARMCLADARGQAGDSVSAVRDLENVVKTGRLQMEDMLTARSLLAEYRAVSGDISMAISELEALLSDRRRYFGMNGAAVLETEGNLAGWRGQAGDPAGAARDYEQLLPRIEQTMGTENIVFQATQNNIVYWLVCSGQATRAIELAEKFIPSCIAVLGTEHVETFHLRRNFARPLKEAGRFAPACEELEALMADQRNVLGEDHPMAIITAAELAAWRGEND